ncbi:GNAT family N-acetyltransferase [Nocardia sp. CDC159]|uniref:GNAT family N-acetyltransferase n=1 Tax=Nocardia pulmonis TaxID=2951408 RepID=A0A9X2EC22_9NOCA|nr:MULTISPECIES: GNAT family N-acetyltransferase [Nocardia]MCM6777560.1 GNAT family N-acetyltransferase [Nocardia pulmonis]MCM6790333.1 GNAT family N-acetyltransferase [Nocardia sp. CDC159]
MNESLFCGTELAARIERAEAELITAATGAARVRRPDAAGFVLPIAGGAACYGEPGSPLNKVVGLGFDGIPSAAELNEIESAYAAAGSPVQVELAHLGDPGLATLLTERGYRLSWFENILGRTIESGYARKTPPGIEIRLGAEDDFDIWLDVVVDGFAHPDEQGVASPEEFPREVLADVMRDMTAAAGVRRYLASRDGAPAGAASMRMSNGIAQLTGAATAPAHRRRGVQTALQSARLADAAQNGCELATITTMPGSKSQQNAQRSGFQLLYTRTVLVKS